MSPSPLEISRKKKSVIGEDVDCFGYPTSVSILHGRRVVDRTHVESHRACQSECINSWPDTISPAATYGPHT